MGPVYKSAAISGDGRFFFRNGRREGDLHKRNGPSPAAAAESAAKPGGSGDLTKRDKKKNEHAGKRPDRGQKLPTFNPLYTRPNDIQTLAVFSQPPRGRPADVRDFIKYSPSWIGTNVCFLLKCVFSFDVLPQPRVGN